MNNIISKEDNYKDLAKRILDKAKQQGASQAEVVISANQGLSVSVRKQDVDTIEFDQGKGLGITVYFGKQTATCSTSDLSDDAIENTVNKACTMAQMMTEDKYCGLADKEIMAFDYTNQEDLDLYHPWDLDPSEAKQLALECEQYGLDFDNRITNSEGSDVSTGQALGIYANSHDFIGVRKSSRHNISCVLVATDKANPQQMQRDYWYSTSRDSSNLSGIKEIGINAAKRTVARLNPRKVKTQKTSVLFAPEMAKGIINSFLSAISGGNLYRKSSFLLDKINQQVIAKNISIIDDPFIKQGFGSSFYDGEGVKTQKRELVSEGILNGYILSSYSARRLGLKSTGNAGGVHNILVNNNSANNYSNIQDIIKNINSGFMVTELMGQGVNIVTGDYSRGASGFWIENGEIAYPVEGITIAGNLKDMLLNISLVGGDVDTRSNILTGSLLIDNMMLAGE